MLNESEKGEAVAKSSESGVAIKRKSGGKVGTKGVKEK